MTTNEDDLGKIVGDNVRLRRKEAGLSQEDLSERTEIPRGTIASLERGCGNPTLQVLVRLSQGLQCEIAELLKPAEKRAQLYLPGSYRRTEKALLLDGKQSKKIAIETLTPPESRYLILEKFQLEEGEAFAGSPHPKGTEEYLFCLEGALEVILAEASYVLSEGSLLRFEGNQKHTYKCPQGAPIGLGLSLIVQVPRL